MKILLVDDTELFLDLQKSYLNRSSFSVSTARSGTEALVAIRSDRPTLVLLDLLMPGMNGDEVCRKVKSDPLTNTIPIIMLSSTQDPELRERCFAAGCDDFVSKPLKRDELLDAIERTVVIAKRRFARIPTHLLANVIHDGKVRQLWIHTISRGGVFLEADPPPLVGAEMDITFFLPGIEQIINAKAKVKWQGTVREDSPSGVGCQFIQIDDPLADIIGNYVNEKLAAVGSLQGFA
ncbi:response regulator [bacterium]|nr:response regulator [bacterium]